MRRVGLTGGIASGKSTVADRWRARGAVIIDADVLAREVVEPGTPALAALVERFGDGILTDDGHLDRPGLARIVFADEQALADLNAVVHPAVRRRAAEIERGADPDAVVVQVIPLLHETGQAADFDEVVVVDVAPETQIARMRSRDGFDEAAARARLRAQAAREDRLAIATKVIDNDGDFAHLVAQADRVWDQLAAG